MTPDQINAKVAEILLAEGQEWGRIPIDPDTCGDCQHYEMWSGEKGGCWSPECGYRPLNFCSDSAATWRLLEYWYVHDPEGFVLEFCRPTLRVELSPLSLSKAFIAAKEKK